MLTATQDLLAAARLMSGRFRGRAKLTAAAERGSIDALVSLCDRLSVSHPPAAHLRYERDHAPVGDWAPVLRADRVCAEIDRINAELVSAAKTLRETWYGPSAVPTLGTAKDAAMRARLDAVAAAAHGAVPEDMRCEIKFRRGHYSSDLTAERVGTTCYDAHLARAARRRLAAARADARAPTITTTLRQRLDARRAAQAEAVRAGECAIRAIVALATAPEAARLYDAVTTACARAGVRTATHSHEHTIVVLDAGAEPHATSMSGSEWASEVGLSAAYCRAAYRVATSEHVWHLPHGASPSVAQGRVYLSDTVRVRNGRGTSLVTECLVAGRGARLAWRAS